MGKKKFSREEIKVVNHVIGLLADQFPLAFNRYERKRLPLKIGIHLDLLATVEGIAPDALKLALRVYTTNKFYRTQLQPGVTRVDLAGKPAGVVTAEQVTRTETPPASAPAPAPAPAPAAFAVRRMSLADLKAAARQRKQQQQGEAPGASG
jgi:sRNA-binding protein